ncbi:MAG: hypothetical protein IJ168_01850 [Eubacterium sp.]|nr:hypothetical protein [Eubacterium sp.]
MQYKLNHNNFCDFAIYKDNVLTPRAYFIPFGTADALAATDVLSERYASDRVTVLSGEWDFAYYAHATELPAVLDTAQTPFNRVTVPSCWQFTGYEPPYYVNTRYQFKPAPPAIPEDCAVGVYRRFFTAEKGKRHYTLAFLGVAGALDVYVNGQYVGYSEGSHNTAEFELDNCLSDGENELVAVVHKFSNGTYLECQDMFRNNGIFRDVLLYETGDNSIYDFELRTAYRDGKYDLTVLPSLKLTKPCVLTVQLPELGVSKSVDVTPEAIDKLTFRELEVAEWSAELPNLYTLLLTLSVDGEVVEVIRRPVGFKHIEIKGNVFYFNNEKIKLLGVNHHDTDPKKGYVMTVEDMERDVKLFKEYNVNCVRTSHYPPDPIFLDLCDIYGVYVVDEADIETHGCQTELHKPGACSHNKAWAPRYWDRVLRMFERDKNHAGITMWSLGNEAWGYANQDVCYEGLKQRTNIPIHYENVVHTRRFAYDVISQMYPWQGKMKKLADGRGLAKKWYSKPYFLCEYAHAMGVGAGELETYVSDFLRADNLMGGCIWEFCDHAVYHEDGPYRWTYGGDHGEEKHDKNFCVDGLFYPDRTPHAGALQMKNCYRPVRAAVTEEGFVFTSLYCFRPLSLTVEWTSYNRLGQLAQGHFSLTLPPHGEALEKLPVGERCETVVFRYLADGETVAAEQLTFADHTELEAERSFAVGNGTLTLRPQQDGIRLSFDGVTATLGASLFRAPLDNDMYLNKVWEKLQLSTERLQLGKPVKDEKRGLLSVEGKLVTGKGKRAAAVSLLCFQENESSAVITLECTDSRLIPFAPRFGLTLRLPDRFDRVNYFGLGERQNLPDFREHALLGEYAMPVAAMREKYIKPQESSMRSGVHRACVTDENGHGLCFERMEQPFIFSADHFTSQQCAAAMHQEELTPQDFTFLHIDGYQLGAASGACGPVPTKLYRKNRLTGCRISVRVTVL